MTRRYYHPNLPPNGGSVTLGESESQHAIRVMRVKVGDEIVLFDGKAMQAGATVSEVTRRDCHCSVLAAEHIDREPTNKLHLAVALPKPDRAKELIERLTELGVATVTPIVAERTQRPPSPSLMDKLRRGVIEACKQSERNVLMQIADPTSLEDYLETAGSVSTKWIAHPNGDFINDVSIEANSEFAALIGPEGGWSDQEVAGAIQAGYKKLGLGKRIYRIETAAVVIAAKLA